LKRSQRCGELNPKSINQNFLEWNASESESLVDYFDMEMLERIVSPRLEV
jgi:hypothetical protein